MGLANNVLDGIATYQKWRVASGLTDTTGVLTAKLNEVTQRINELKLNPDDLKKYLKKYAEESCGSRISHLSRMLNGFATDGKMPGDLEALFEAKNMSLANIRRNTLFAPESKPVEKPAPIEIQPSSPRPKK